MTLVKYRRPNYVFNHFVNRFFNDVYHGQHNESSASSAARSFSPSVDVAETDAAFEVQVTVPGIAKEDITVSLEDGKLTISGERKLSKEEDGKNYRRVESTYGNFSRSFYLPDNVDSENIGASYENGILQVTIPKKEVKPLKTSIAVQ